MVLYLDLIGLEKRTEKQMGENMKYELESKI